MEHRTAHHPSARLRHAATGRNPAGLARPARPILYDHLGGRKRLPPTRTLDLATDARGDGLKNRTGKHSPMRTVRSTTAGSSSQCIGCGRTPRTHRDADRAGPCRGASDEWQATLLGPQGEERVTARVLVNATGPWVTDLLRRIHVESRRSIRLVKGSHIVLPRLYAGEHAFLIQNPDRRVVFAIPFERDFTLVGTTDSFWNAEPGSPQIDDAEVVYLLDAVARTFAATVVREDIVWVIRASVPCSTTARAKAHA